jgi:membrane protein implicated in regulation of membrane protease activity
VFLAIDRSLPRLRQVLASPRGVLAVAAIYGPAIWLVMSLVVISLFTGRSPAITFRWWVQLVGHIPFVAVPIVAMIGRPTYSPSHAETS